MSTEDEFYLQHVSRSYLLSASICEPFSPALRILKVKETYLASVVTKILIVQDGKKKLSHFN